MPSRMSRRSHPACLTAPCASSNLCSNRRRPARAQHLRDDHPNLFHDLSPAQFDAAVANLSAHADLLDDDQLLVGLMRLGAMPGVRDGQRESFRSIPRTGVSSTRIPSGCTRLRTGRTSSARPAGRIFCARVVAVGGRPIEDVIAAVSRLVRITMTELMLRVTTYLNTPEALHGLGRARSRSRDVHVRARRQHVRRQLDAADRAQNTAAESAIWNTRCCRGESPPPCRRTSPVVTSRSGRPRLPASASSTSATTRRSCRRGAVARRTSKAAKTKRLRAVIVDLRLNGGGDNHTYRLSARRVAPRFEDREDRRAHLAHDVLRGQELRRRSERVAHPIFVGEPSGGSPNLYGDTVSTLLPTSGLELRVARIYWQKSTADDPRVAIHPSGASLTSSEAFFAGQDPVLAAAIGAALGTPKVLAAAPPRFSYDRARLLGLRLGEAVTSGGVVRQSLHVRRGSWTEEGVLDASGRDRAMARRFVFARIRR